MAKMHQIQSRPGPDQNSMDGSPGPLAGFKGPISNERGKEGTRNWAKGRGKEGKERDGMGGEWTLIVISSYLGSGVTFNELQITEFRDFSCMYTLYDAWCDKTSGQIVQ